jgi:hypothetical protein
MCEVGDYTQTSAKTHKHLGVEVSLLSLNEKRSIKNASIVDVFAIWRQTKKE